jgi:TP901 family phage tail tape measure protein
LGVLVSIRLKSKEAQAELEAWISKNKNQVINIRFNEGFNKSLQLAQNSAEQLSNRLKQIGTNKDFEKAFKKNPELTKQFSNLTDSVNKFNTGLRNGTYTAEDWKKANLSNEVRTLSSNLKIASVEVNTLSSKLVDGAKKFGTWLLLGGIIAGAVRAIKSGISSIVELDTALTNMNKVLDLTESETKQYSETAYKLGLQLARTATEVAEATAVFGQAGYSLTDSTELAKQALLLTNIADGIDDVSQASSYLIAILSAYNLKVSDAANVVDILNEVSNRYAVDTNNLAEGLQRASGSLALTGTSLKELTALLTAGYTQLRNMEKVSTGLITISSRLRGMSESGEEIDGLLPELQEKFKKFANVDIEDLNGELRSTYDIIVDLAKQWDTMSAEEQAYISELASGIRQSPVLLSIINQIKTAQDVVVTASDVTGSALKENERVLDSIQGRLINSRQLFRQCGLKQLIAIQ